MNQPTGTLPTVAAATQAGLLECAYPQSFGAAPPSAGAGVYLCEPLAARLAEFFRAKGLAAIKEEDRLERWHDDWIQYQAEHRLYARLLCPAEHSASGGEFDLLRYARFLELFAYYSPAHGYSLQVTFLGLFPILMGANANLKTEAVAALEAGGLLGLGVSEKAHGADLLGNEFILMETAPGQCVANGSKYYIGNANCAAMLSVLARRSGGRFADRARRAPFVLFALRPRRAAGFGNLRKIRTLGVRSAFVGEFEVKDHPVPTADVIADGRGAWDATLGTVTLGKFFLGFGSIGICEHALEEAAGHLRSRILYGKPAVELPHLRMGLARAYARLTAMKLYAYRALDYVHAAGEYDRRYLLFCAVQKATVSTEGLKVMDLLLDCMGAKGFESDTYFEMALRDAQLIPRLEGSTHINLGATAQFIPRYFAEPDPPLAGPCFLALDGIPRRENPYLTRARCGAIHTIAFPHYLAAYRPLLKVPNVRFFAKQARRHAGFLGSAYAVAAIRENAEAALALGRCQATIAYAQLVAESAHRLAVPTPLISAIFELLVSDLSVLSLALASSPHVDPASRALLRGAVVPSMTAASDWDFVSQRLAGFRGGSKSNQPAK